MTDSARIIPLMYEKEKKRKKNIARFHKCIFHMHSPASHDYRLIDGVKNWRDILEKDLIEIWVTKGIPFDLLSMEDLNNLIEGMYESRSELLAFFLVAYELLNKGIELVVITDHNTISGYDKLVKAIELVYKQFKSIFKVYTQVVLGIEISCSDKCHVIGIFDYNNTEKKEILNAWIEEYIMTDNDGTYLNSKDVLEAINRMDGIGYIAHLNSAPLFNDGHVSGVYKKTLFNLNHHCFFGVSDLDKGEELCRKISNFTDKNFNYIVDEDAHLLSEIGLKFFWIKGQKLDYETVYDALNDFQTSISHSKPSEIESYIKSLYIDNKCFYKDDDGNPLVINFSENMNSLIGGRGTGKSTLLNIIEFLASQIVENEKTLEYIIKQGTICLLYAHKGKDYYIMFHSGGGDENDREFIKKCFSSSNKSLYFDKESERQQRKTVIQDRIQIYTYDGESISEITEVKKLLDDMFTRKFSVNHLVNIAGNQSETVEFVLDLLNKNSKLNKGIVVSSLGKNWGWIERQYNHLDLNLSERLKEVNQVINPFNQSQTNKIKITYTQKKMHDFLFDWRNMLDISYYDVDKSFMGYNITNKAVIGLLDDLSFSTNPIDVALKIYHRNYDHLTNSIDIDRYCMTRDFKTVDSDFKKLDKKNTNNFFNEIRNIIKNKNIQISEFLRNYLKHMENFGLKFNINNKESPQRLKVLFKPIDEISMGQKVVAMISFILEYSKFTNDLSPLIIDQPEDNLDNQYIYRNLVKDFRNIKDTRQIIIATHNSTILVNSGCENVIILESNHERTWIDKTGYSKKKDINHRIINILEGGVEAFQHKIKVYRNNI